MMAAAPERRIRVLVVDDSALVRKAITDALADDPEIEVVGSACDAYVAREKIERLDPDVVTLDLEMPRMDGLTFLRILMEHHPLPVVVVSSLTQQGSQAAMDAVEAGAVDVLAKPDGTMSIGALADRLAYHVKAAAAAGGRLRRSPPRAVEMTGQGDAPDRADGTSRADTSARPGGGAVRMASGLGSRGLIVIGASTGGVEALRTVLPRLPTGLPPILVVQHISAHFSRIVAERLDAICGVRVREAGDGEPLEPGTCVIAPGDHHLAVVRHGTGFRTRLLQTPPIHHCRPAVDVLFRSAAEAAGAGVVATLMTGMGSDGAIGLQAIRQAGGTTIVQDEATCVVYGMPRAAVALGVVDRIVPLAGIPEAIVAAVAARAASG